MPRGGGKGAIRPTTDRVKESLFNLAGPAWEGKVVLDLFAGSGALGLEALSRGAARAVFVDSGREALALIRENLKRCDAGDAGESGGAGVVVPGSVFDPGRRRGLKKLAKEGYNLIFLDPPYGLGLVGKALDLLAEEGLAAPGALVISEQEAAETALRAHPRYRRLKGRDYGAARIDLWTFDAAES